jgi:hypothetical protein
MPVRSKAQQAFLATHRPKVLQKWKAEGVKTSPKGLPDHVAPKLPNLTEAHVMRGQKTFKAR